MLRSYSFLKINFTWVLVDLGSDLFYGKNHTPRKQYVCRFLRVLFDFPRHLGVFLHNCVRIIQWLIKVWIYCCHKALTWGFLRPHSEITNTVAIDKAESLDVPNSWFCSVSTLRFCEPKLWLLAWWCSMLWCSMPQLSFLGAVTPRWLWPFYLSINQAALKD